ncbi:MAG: hypothetical protein AB1772_00980 [Candidatus Zixiibacteriota bacterium]
MNCDKVREELELDFGTNQSSAEVADHLRTCESCRAYRDELINLAPRLGDDDNIALTFAEIEHAVRMVEGRIAPRRSYRPVFRRWLQPLVRVAAAAAIALFAYGAYELGQMQGMSEDGVSLTSTGVTTDNLTLLLTGDLGTELDDDMVRVLIDEFSSSAPLGASESLLDDISEEEMKYLEEHFEIGDLL